MARDILHTTTQKGVRHAVLPLSRRYRINHLNLHAHYLGGKWTMDHVESKYQSIRGHTGSFTISNGNFVAVYPQATKNTPMPPTHSAAFATTLVSRPTLKSIWPPLSLADIPTFNVPSINMASNLRLPSPTTTTNCSRLMSRYVTLNGGGDMLCQPTISRDGFGASDSNTKLA